MGKCEDCKHWNDALEMCVHPYREECKGSTLWWPRSSYVQRWPVSYHGEMFDPGDRTTKELMEDFPAEEFDWLNTWRMVNWLETLLHSKTPDYYKAVMERELKELRQKEDEHYNK